MTEIEALNETVKMWTWISEKEKSSGKFISKRDYLEKDEVIANKEIYNDCFLCQYAYERKAFLKSNESTCSFCPIKSWGKRNIYLCMEDRAYYNEWAYSYSRTKRIKAALNIAKAAQNRIEELQTLNAHSKTENI